MSFQHTYAQSMSLYSQSPIRSDYFNSCVPNTTCLKLEENSNCTIRSLFRQRKNITESVYNFPHAQTTKKKRRFQWTTIHSRKGQKTPQKSIKRRISFSFNNILWRIHLSKKERTCLEQKHLSKNYDGCKILDDSFYFWYYIFGKFGLDFIPTFSHLWRYS